MAPLVRTEPAPADLFVAVKARVSIGEMLDYHGLKYCGRSMQCPNHAEHMHGDRSMSAWISSTGRTWHCHGCGHGGSVVDILSILRGIPPLHAVRALCDYAGIEEVDRNRAYLAPARLQAQSALPRVAPEPSSPPSPARPEVHAFLRRSQDLLLASNHARRYLALRPRHRAETIRELLDLPPVG